MNPVPVLATGGLADGAGVAADLMLGAEGALFSTRFLTTIEPQIPSSYKQAIIGGDGHDTPRGGASSCPPNGKGARNPLHASCASIHY